MGRGQASLRETSATACNSAVSKITDSATLEIAAVNSSRRPLSSQASSPAVANDPTTVRSARCFRPNARSGAALITLARLVRAPLQQFGVVLGLRHAPGVGAAPLIGLALLLAALAGVGVACLDARPGLLPGRLTSARRLPAGSLVVLGHAHLPGGSPRFDHWGRRERDTRRWNYLSKSTRPRSVPRSEEYPRWS